jgi:hypothetical protein
MLPKFILFFATITVLAQAGDGPAPREKAPAKMTLDQAYDRALATDWEERWVREEGFLCFVPRAIADALAFLASDVSTPKAPATVDIKALAKNSAVVIGPGSSSPLYRAAQFGLVAIGNGGSPQR